MHVRELVFPAAGIGPEDVDVTGAYDAFTFTAMLQLEAFGFCEPGAGGHYVSSGAIELGGRRPNNTSGGHLCEGYTHGMSMVIENVRQLRGTVDDYCPRGSEGVHTYDYRPGRLPPGARRPDRHEHGLGLARHRQRRHPRVPPCLSPSSTAAWR